MFSGFEYEQMVEDTLKIVIIAVTLTVIITKSIVESSIKSPEEIKQAADKQQVIEQLTPHQKKVLGL